MSYPRQVLDAVTGFASTVSDRSDIADVLHELSARVSSTLAITGAGVSLLQDEDARFVAADNEVVARIEHMQDDTQEGPCVEVYRRNDAVAFDDLRVMREQWPRFAPHALAAGVGAVASVPLRHGETTIGAVDLYDAGPRTWSDDELRAAQLLADIAAIYVTNASQLDRERRLNEQLQTALDSRIVIEQAKGVVAAARGIDVDEAFAVLRKHARDHRATLRAVAEAVVHAGLRP